MRNRASLLIVCPRCGLGNRLRVMVSAIDVAQRLGLRLAHLWRRDAPVRSTYLMPDEELGAGSCDFETLFEPIPFLEPFADEGQTVRLLSEHAHLCQQQGISIVDELHHPRGPIARSHLEGVGALLLLTSESLPVREPTKIELYDRYFTPTTAFADMLEARRDDLQGRWLGAMFLDFLALSRASYIINSHVPTFSIELVFSRGCVVRRRRPASGPVPAAARAPLPAAPSLATACCARSPSRSVSWCRLQRNGCPPVASRRPAFSSNRRPRSGDAHAWRRTRP